MMSHIIANTPLFGMFYKTQAFNEDDRRFPRYLQTSILFITSAWACFWAAYLLDNNLSDSERAAINWIGVTLCIIIFWNKLPKLF
eukprot:UN05064